MIENDILEFMYLDPVIGTYIPTWPSTSTLLWCVASAGGRGGRCRPKSSAMLGNLNKLMGGGGAGFQLMAWGAAAVAGGGMNIYSA